VGTVPFSYAAVVAPKELNATSPFSCAAVATPKGMTVISPFSCATVVAIDKGRQRERTEMATSTFLSSPGSFNSLIYSHFLMAGVGACIFHLPGISLNLSWQPGSFRKFFIKRKNSQKCI
jgi:hypothetical protein